VTAIHSGIFRSAERAVGRDLASWLAEQRAAGVSYQQIVSLLQDMGVIVTDEAVRSWDQRLNGTGAAEAAS